MAYVDIDKARKHLRADCLAKYPTTYINGLLAASEELTSIPAAEVVEVKCRCVDCKYYHRYGKTSLVFEGKNVQAGWCYLRGKTDEEHRMLPFVFCSYGERKST